MFDNDIYVKNELIAQETLKREYGKKDDGNSE